MLSDEFLDKFLRESIADAKAFRPGFVDVIAQAKEANRFRRAMLTIAELGRRQDAEVAREALQIEESRR